MKLECFGSDGTIRVVVVDELVIINFRLWILWTWEGSVTSIFHFTPTKSFHWQVVLGWIDHCCLEKPRKCGCVSISWWILPFSIWQRGILRFSLSKLGSESKWIIIRINSCFYNFLVGGGSMLTSQRYNKKKEHLSLSLSLTRMWNISCDVCRILTSKQSI